MTHAVHEIVIATGNPHKVEELSAILADDLAAMGIRLVGLRDLAARGLGPFHEPEEVGGTFEENAAIKAISYARQTGMACLADDSGLEIDALGGRPGVISSHFFNDGRTDGAASGMDRAERDRRNNRRVLDELRGVPIERRSARFVCVMAVAGHQVCGGAGFQPARSPAQQAFQTFDGVFRRHDRTLPHMQIGGATYFITFRTAGSLLDDEERAIVLRSCIHWHGARAVVHVATVMPDHVHLLIRPIRGPDGSWPTLISLVHSIKSFSAGEINRRRGVTGRLWQSEYFDRIVRDDREMDDVRAYIQTNPVRAGLCARAGDYPFTAIDGRAAGGLEARRPLGNPDPGARVRHFRGTFEGRIGLPEGECPRGRADLLIPRGAHGFGYDPIFLVSPGHARTSAELDPPEKNRLSHRARAAGLLGAWLRAGGLHAPPASPGS